MDRQADQGTRSPSGLFWAAKNTNANTKIQIQDPGKDGEYYLLVVGERQEAGQRPGSI